MTRKKKKEPSLLQRRLHKNLIKNGDGDVKRAMLDSGYALSTASKQSKRTVEKGSSRDFFLKCLEKAGVTDDLIAAKLKQGFEATKVISANVISKNGIDVPDFATQHKFMESAIKIKGHYAPQEEEISGDINIKWE